VLSPSVWPTFVLMVPIHVGFIQNSFEIHREVLSFDRDGGERPRDREKSRRISDEEQGKKLARENKRVSSCIKGIIAVYSAYVRFRFLFPIDRVRSVTETVF
jgi:hypothetical protein